MTERKPITIEQQAFFVADLERRCRMLDGTFAAETFVLLTANDAAELKALADRLFRMAPHEAAIRKLVTGR